MASETGTTSCSYRSQRPRSTLQFLVESVLLSVGGRVVGILVAIAAVRAVSAMTSDVPVLLEWTSRGLLVGIRQGRASAEVGFILVFRPRP